MATQLTNPVSQPSATHQGVTRMEIQVPHTNSGGAAVINTNKVEIRYEVSTWDSTGKVVARAARTVPFSAWPAAFKVDMNAIYQKVVQDAKLNNLIGEGTDEDI